MRIIAGEAKSLPLKTLPGSETRPTTDRIKETLFNMIHPYLTGCRFLDLFAGSGSIGLEALSRGAKEAVFVERNKKAAAVIRENMEFTKLASGGRLYCMDVFAALRELEHQEQEPFDIVFMDPPYHQLLEKQVMEALLTSHLIAEHTLLIAEASRETDFSYLEDLGYELEKIKLYKTNVHTFIRKRA
ncbi:MAG: 16S rRNA (guanine(966)-N(2))-methyltransferase RsmD [Lachnospiraceae bacterium]|nr:16S rRNA (guanine(966)-N(2))-methyltransferase RsmD [Lachnospiraceae bacterium]